MSIISQAAFVGALHRQLILRTSDRKLDDKGGMAGRLTSTGELGTLELTRTETSAAVQGP